MRADTQLTSMDPEVTPMPQEAAPAAPEKLSPYDFYRCLRCHRLITSIEMETALGPSDRPVPTWHQWFRWLPVWVRRLSPVSAVAPGLPCSCGGTKFSPCNMPTWGWLSPRVLAFAWKRVRGQA